MHALLAYVRTDKQNYNVDYHNPLLYPGFLGVCHEAVATSLASERSERDTLRSVQLRIADIYIYIYIYIYIVRANFVLITRKQGGA